MKDNFTINDLNFDKCMICGSEMLIHGDFDCGKCRNGCTYWETDMHTGYSNVIVRFEKKTFYNIDFYNLNQPFLSEIAEFIDSINYWRENERYLIKIMERS